MIKKILSSVVGQIIAALLGLAFISAYSMEPQAATTSNTRVLADSSWTLQLLTGQTVNSQRPLTIDLDSTRLQGFAGCNRFNSNYTRGEDGSLGISPISTTKVACNDARDSLEQHFLETLQTVDQYALINNQLHLLDAKHKVLMIFNQTNLTTK